jgi:hypothetical protein
LIRPSDNWQHRSLLLPPTGTELEQLIQSADKNTVENNNGKITTTTAETKRYGMKNRKPLTPAACS